MRSVEKSPPASPVGEPLRDDELSFYGTFPPSRTTFVSSFPLGKFLAGGIFLDSERPLLTYWASVDLGLPQTWTCRAGFHHLLSS